MFKVYVSRYDGSEESFEFDNIHEARVYASQDCVDALMADIADENDDIIESWHEGCLI